MATASEFHQYWVDRIPRDLAPFKDPGTSLDVTSDHRALLVRWESRGKVLDARFTFTLDTGVYVTFQGRTTTYRSFLSSPEMADLLGLAKMMLQSQPQTLFIPTKAIRGDVDDSDATPATVLLQDLLEHPDDLGLTRILIVTGEAGAGKTRVLQELVRQQADQNAFEGKNRQALPVRQCSRSGVGSIQRSSRYRTSRPPSNCNLSCCLCVGSFRSIGSYYRRVR